MMMEVTLGPSKVQLVKTPIVLEIAFTKTVLCPS